MKLLHWHALPANLARAPNTVGQHRAWHALCTPRCCKTTWSACKALALGFAIYGRAAWPGLQRRLTQGLAGGRSGGRPSGQLKGHPAKLLTTSYKKPSGAAFDKKRLKDMYLADQCAGTRFVHPTHTSAVFCTPCVPACPVRPVVNQTSAWDMWSA